LCYTESGFATHITSNEGGKVLISLTSTAGGFTAGATNSNSLMKACVTNGGTIPTGGNLGNML